MEFTDNDILMALIVDGSGSMGMLKEATIEGVNSVLDVQGSEEGTAFVSLVVFDTSFHVKCVAQDAREVTRLNPGSYSPHGGTALYDAVGVGIKGLEEWVLSHPGFHGKVLVTIWTDGKENASRNWNLAQLNQLISDRQSGGWAFNFIGSGSSAWTEAKTFTALPQDAFTRVYASASSTTDTYAAMNTSTSIFRGAGAGARYSAPQSDVSSDQV